jgi:LPS-assembly protein
MCLAVGVTCRTRSVIGASQQSNAPMLVQATEIRYDYTNNSVAAVGNLQIYYAGATIEADQVI